VDENNKFPTRQVPLTIIRLSTANHYVIPGLSGIWDISSLETTDMGADNKATINFRRVAT
jgi:hypothetical protein